VSAQVVLAHRRRRWSRRAISPYPPAAIVAGVVAACLVGPLLYRTNQTNAQTALLESTQNAAPSWGHLLGTDQAGFDLVGRIMVGGKTSLEVGFAAAALATVVGTLWGAAAGMAAPWLDSVMMRIVDVVLSIPLLFVAIVLAVVFRPSILALILIIGGTSWVGIARLVRGEALTLRERGYVEAARSMGAGGTRIIVHHILPNAVGTIIVAAVFQVADAILVLAALGFLGLGVPSPATDWGSMLADGVNYALDGYWWEIYPTGAAIIIVVVALNLIGEGLAARVSASR
jgi:peptide/nickel transport system permease protein